MAEGHVANWGNDENDGLSWETAKRSLQGAHDISSNPTNIKGCFNEALINNITGEIINGVGYVFIDGSFLGELFFAFNCAVFNNIIFNNWSRIKSANYSDGALNNCTIKNSGIVGLSSFYSDPDTVYNQNGFSVGTLSVMHQLTTFHIHLSNNPSEELSGFTMHNIGTIYSYATGDVLSYDNKDKHIYSNSKVCFQSKSHALFSLYINCDFKFIEGSEGADEVAYAYPTGANDDAKLQNLKDRMAIVYGGVESDYLVGCKYYSGSYNDIFLDADNGSFYLVEGCIASNMGYNGEYVGAKPEGKVIQFDQDYSNIINIDANGKITDQNNDASAEGNVLDFGKVRHLPSLEALGIRSARNGVEMNAVANLGSQIGEGASVLTDQKNYIVEGTPIVLDDGGGTIRAVDERFMAIDEGAGAGLGFAAASGFVREIDIDKPQAIRLKCSLSSVDLSSVAHVNGYITLDLFIEPKVNVNANGEPTYGNLDTGFVGPGVPLFTRYIKDLPIVKANQLPA